ncbi:hypothetical protein EDD22DRAFT_972422, partial [Suillus occidentalis]
MSSPLQHNARTTSVCPVHFAMTFLVLTSHNLTLPSPPLAIFFPSGDNAMHHTSFVSSRQSSLICAPLASSHNRNEPSTEYVMMCHPSRKCIKPSTRWKTGSALVLPTQPDAPIVDSVYFWDLGIRPGYPAIPKCAVSLTGSTVQMSPVYDYQRSIQNECWLGEKVRQSFFHTVLLLCRIAVQPKRSGLRLAHFPIRKDCVWTVPCVPSRLHTFLPVHFLTRRVQYVYRLRSMQI